MRILSTERFRSFLLARCHRHNERLALSRLAEASDSMLRDIGITRADVQRLRPQPFHHRVG